MANETPSGTGASADLADISFEDALRELEAIVESLEHGDVSLDDAIAAFERGTALKAHCRKARGGTDEGRADPGAGRRWRAESAALQCRRVGHVASAIRA